MDFESSDDCEITTLPWLLLYRIIKWTYQKCERSAFLFKKETFFFFKQENIFVKFVNFTLKVEQFS